MNGAERADELNVKMQKVPILKHVLHYIGVALDARQALQPNHALHVYSLRAVTQSIARCKAWVMLQFSGIAAYIVCKMYSTCAAL
jgi:hypothetical protein